MNADREEALARVLAQLQRRYGPGMLQRGLAPAPDAVIPSGLARLDALLAGGGIPIGASTELAGAATSGASTLLLLLVAAAQAQQLLVAYLDLEHTFDPAYAVACGVALEALLLVRPADPQAALALLGALLRHGQVGLVVLDPTHRLAATADPLLPARLAHALRTRRSTLLARSPQPVVTPPWGAQPALRLAFTRTAWLGEGTAVTGWRSQVQISGAAQAAPQTLLLDMPLRERPEGPAAARVPAGSGAG